MMMTLPELQEIMGDRIRVTLNKELTSEERETENAQTALVIETAKQMINNGDLILRTEKLAAMNRALNGSVAMQLIYGKDNE